MPIQTIWVHPEKFLERRGVKVFHTYKDDDLDQGTNRYWFTLSPPCSVEDARCEERPCRHVFDVRDLSTWQAPIQPPTCTGKYNTPENHQAWERYWRQEQEAIENAIRAAIDRGELTLHGVRRLIRPPPLIRSTPE